MKKIIPLILLLGMGITAQASQEWRTFTSLDGERTFVGQLTGFDRGSETVTVLNSNRQTLSFKLNLVSQEDRDWVVENSSDLKPAANLRLRFEALRERKDSVRGDESRTTTNEGGYIIHVNSFSPHMIRDAKVEYLMIHRKDQVSGGSTDHVVKGSQTVSIIPNSSAPVQTQTVDLVNYFKAGKVSGGGGGCAAGRCGSNSATATRSQRSRDILIGCVARVIVNDQVVSVSATSPDLLRKYQAELGGDYENQASR